MITTVWKDIIVCSLWTFVFLIVLEKHAKKMKLSCILLWISQITNIVLHDICQTWFYVSINKYIKFLCTSEIHIIFEISPAFTPVSNFPNHCTISFNSPKISNLLTQKVITAFNHLSYLKHICCYMPSYLK